jgi:hypothetical protein
MAWSATGLVLPSAAGTGHAACVFNGKIYASGYGGQLYESTGLGAFVQVAPALNPTARIGDLIVFNSKLYALCASDHLLEWTGSAWSLKASLSGGFTPGDIRYARLATAGGNLYLAGFSIGAVRMYRWDGASTWTLVSAASGFSGAGISGPYAFSDGNIYFGNTGGSTSGQLYRFVTASNALSLVAPRPSASYSSSTPIYLAGTIYGVLSNNHLYAWNGSGAWSQTIVPGGYASGTFTGACLTRSGRIFSGSTNAGATGGKLFSWGPSESDWTLEADTVSTYTRVAELFEYEGALYGLLSSDDDSASGIGAIFRNGVEPPSTSRILPSSSGRLSHARILRGFRSPRQAQSFHDLMKGRAT